MAFFGKQTKPQTYKYPGVPVAMDGASAVIMCEREACDAAGAFAVPPATAMGEAWAQQVDEGHLNVAKKPLIHIQAEGEHAAAGITAGLTLSGLRATNFATSQGVAYMHESLYTAVGKRLPYVLNITARAIAKSSENMHCGHDDYHCMDDTGFIQMFANSPQAVADLNIIGRKIAELSLNPIAIAQDGFLTSHSIEPLKLPERELIAEYLGLPDDIIETPTPAQRILYGETRRRIPLQWDVDQPMMTGAITNQDAYMQTTAAQRPYFFDHTAKFADQCMSEWYQLTGRRYQRVNLMGVTDGDYLIVGQGSFTVTAAAVARHLQRTRGLRIAVADMTLFRPFPGDLISKIIKGKKAVLVLERTDQPLAEDLPLMREFRAVIGKCLENGRGNKKSYPDYETLRKLEDAPTLFSGCYGLGGKDLQPGDLIAAIENLLPNGAQQKFFYLGIEFTRTEPFTPKQEIQMQQVEQAYPGVRELALASTQNPNLMPADSLTVRMHSIGGWGAMTAGKNLAMSLYDLLGQPIKARPKYGSEKKGQPTVYYLAIAPEPIQVNCEFHQVNVVLAADPNAFSHTQPLLGLEKNGTFILQSHHDNDEAVWQSLPKAAQQYCIDKQIKVFYIDAFKIAREEATRPDLQFRMQGIAFQGAFFKALPLAANAEKTDDEILQAVRATLSDKFAHKGEALIEANYRIVKRGFEEIRELAIDAMTVDQSKTISAKTKPISLPILLSQRAANDAPQADIHRFWNQTGYSYVNGHAADNLTDPFLATAVMPAATGVFRDMTTIRQEHPVWIPENCTACGDCFAYCPDTAIPGLINSVNEVFETNIKRIEKQGRSVKHLRRAIRIVERKYHELTAEKSEGTHLQPIFAKAIGETIKEYPAQDQEAVTQEFSWFKDVMGEFKFALVKPYHDAVNKRQPRSGGLYSITINPYTCKGCMECVKECEDGALAAQTQTAESVAKLRSEWEYWLDLPSSNPKYNRVDDLDEKIGALHTLLQDKSNYQSLSSGDSACSGCGEKSVVHLFTATVTALMQPRVKQHIARIDQLISGMEKHIRFKLVENLDIADVDTIEDAIDNNLSVDLTLSKLSTALDEGKASQPIDKSWLRWAIQIVAKLKHLKWQYLQGVSGSGRAPMGISNSTGCSSMWGSSFPFNPYPFPWTHHLLQDSPSVALGLFEGHMQKMAEGFKAIRMAELEIAGKYKKEEHDKFFTYFNWRQFNDEEYFLCPPLVCIGGDGAMYDSGLQNLSHALMSATPLKILVLDTQLHSLSGGQSTSSAYVNQSHAFGNDRSMPDTRKELSLIAMAHRTAYVLQSAQSHLNHLLEGFIDGLNFRGPAVWNIYSVCQPEHGVADDMSTRQSKMAVESRAYPLMSYHPAAGKTWKHCLSLQGNPQMEDAWCRYTLAYTDEYGNEESMELPFTFADWALTEGRFRQNFTRISENQWNDDMLLLHEYIGLDESAQQDHIPYIWAIDPNNNHLIRVLVSPPMVAATRERLDFWRMLKSLTGDDEKIDPQAIANQAKAEATQDMVAKLMNLVTGGDTDQLLQTLTAAPAAKLSAAAPSAPQAEEAIAATSHSASTATQAAAPAPAGHEPVWIETPDCTTCDECVEINPKIFQYNSDKKAVVVDPTAGTFEDIVKAAEKCTAVIIHPGTPWNPDEPNLEKLIKRAEKFQ